MVVEVIAAGAVIAGAIGGIALGIGRWIRADMRDLREAVERIEARRRAEREADRKVADERQRQADERQRQADERQRQADERQRQADERHAKIMAELASPRASVEGLQRQQARDAEALGKRIDDLARRMDSMDTRLDSMDTRLGSMEARLASVEVEVAGLKAQFSSFKEFMMPRAAPPGGPVAEPVAAAAPGPAQGAPALRAAGPDTTRGQAQAGEARRAAPAPPGQGTPRP